MLFELAATLASEKSETDIGVHQREERDRDKQELRQRRRPRPGRSGPASPRAAPASGTTTCKHGDAQRQNQRKMPDFGNHSGSISAATAHLRRVTHGNRNVVEE